MYFQIQLHIGILFSCARRIVGSNNDILQPKAGQKSSLDWQIVQKKVPVPYQNSLQVAELVPTNLACVVAQMESKSGLKCVAPEGPNCYKGYSVPLLLALSLGLGGSGEF